MADLFKGPRSISPWLEKAVLERLQRQHAGRITRIAYVMEIDDEHHGLITDGSVTALVRCHSDTSTLSTGVVRLSDWRITVEKYEENNNTIPASYAEFGVYQQQLAVVVQVSSLEHVGQVTSAATPSPSVLQSPDVRRHLQQHHQQSSIPLAATGTLILQANSVDTLMHIALCSADPLPVGNLGAVLWDQQDAGTLDALVASAMSPLQEEKQESDVDLTMQSDSEEEHNAVKPIEQQGIQAMLLDEDESSEDESAVIYVSTSPPPKDSQNTQQERSTTRPLQPENRQHSDDGDLSRPLLSRDDSRMTIHHSNRRPPVQISLSETGEHWGLSQAGDLLREFLKTAVTAKPIELVAPPIVGIQTACAGDGIRVWLAEL